MNRKLQLSGIVFLLYSQYAYAELQAFVDRSTILESQTIELTLRGNSQGDPDFSVLEKDFNILSSRTNSQYQSINGRVSSWIDWNLTLEPKSTGELTIPAIELNSEKSTPVKVQVNALDPQLRAAIQSLVFFETGVSSKSVYVQAQLVFTRKLYYARGAQLYGEIPGTPEIENAVVRMITPATPVSIDISGRPFTLIEQKYAIFPERSGRLVIPAVAASGNVRLRAQPGFVGGRTRIRAISESIEIAVQPIPASYPALQPWLPASEVNIADAWGEQPDNLIVGVPVTRVLVVQAHSSIGSIIPPLQPGFPKALRAYPQAPEISEQSISEGLAGLRREEYSISAQRSGPINLPGVELTWWDTDTNEVKVARIPEQTIQVALNPDAPGSLTADELVNTPELKPSPQPDQDAGGTRDVVLDNSSKIQLTLLVLLVALVALIALSRRYFSVSEFYRKIISGNPDTARENKLFNNLEIGACQQELNSFKSKLTEWLSVANQVPITEALQILDRDEASHRLLSELNRGIYAQTLSGDRQIQLITAIMQLAKLHRQRKRAPIRTAKKHYKELPELFPVGQN